MHLVIVFLATNSNYPASTQRSASGVSSAPAHHAVVPQETGPSLSTSNVLFRIRVVGLHQERSTRCSKLS